MSVCRCGFPSVCATSSRGKMYRECALGSNGCGILGYLEDEVISPDLISLQAETMDKNKQALTVVEPVAPMEVPYSWGHMTCCDQVCAMEHKVIHYGNNNKFSKCNAKCNVCGNRRLIVLPTLSVEKIVRQEMDVDDAEAGRLIGELLGSEKGDEGLALLCKKNLISKHLHKIPLESIE